VDNKFHTMWDRFHVVSQGLVREHIPSASCDILPNADVSGLAFGALDVQVVRRMVYYWTVRYYLKT